MPVHVSLSTAAALAPIIPPDLPPGKVTASTALACPPVTRAVDLYTATMLRLSWMASAPTLAWLRRPVGTVPAKIRDVRTLQDLVLHNRSLWLVARDDSGQITAAAHIAVEHWGYDADGHLMFRDEVIPESLLPMFVVFHGAKAAPLLEVAQVTLQHYAALAQTMLDRSETPIAIHELALQENYNGPEPGDPDYDEEHDPVRLAQKNYASARGRKGGAVTVTPRNVKLNVHQVQDDGQMLLGARNAVRKDVANFTNLPASLLDGDDGSSDYANTLQNRNEFLELSLALFTGPITERLSMDDVTPEGETVELNLPTFDAGPSDSRGNLGTATTNEKETNA